MRAATFFVAELLRNGVTTALTFATSHPVSVDAAFEAAQARGLRIHTGKHMLEEQLNEMLSFLTQDMGEVL